MLSAFFRILGIVVLVSYAQCIAAQQNLGERLRHVIAGKSATVGVAVIFNGSELVTVNNMYRYPMMSVYKFPQALSVIDYMHKHESTLATEILVKKSDLQENTHSPLRDSNPNGNFNITIGDLLKYSLIESDNNACDILFKYIGGPQVTEKYIHNLGIKDIAISQTEASMNQTDDNCLLNWIKPSAAVLMLETFLQNQMFNKQEMLFIERALSDSKHGDEKLKAGLPKNVLIGHKTGSSGRNEFGYKIADNDMGFVVLPNGQYYTIAVFVMNSQETDKANAAIIAKISKTVYDYFEEYYLKK